MVKHALAAGCLTAAGASAVLTPAVIALARRRGWVDRPRPDRWSQRPTALMGGTAIYAATMLGAIVTGAIREDTAPVWIAASAMFLLGLVDDFCHLRPHIKLVGQIAAACWLLL